MNALKAVFWDYPALASPAGLSSFLDKHKAQPRVNRWILRRFLEHGRAVDALGYFSVREISEALPGLRLSPYSMKKWRRIIEVYGRD
jgi:hypothetical protein